MATPDAPPGIAPARDPAPPGLLAMRVDFAHAVGSRILVYGWIAGLSEWASSAILRVGEQEFELLTDAVRVKRPDVTENFRDQGLRGDDHGFLALLELTEPASRLNGLWLNVYLRSGKNAESEWPVLQDSAIAGATLRAHEAALRPLIPSLSARQKRVLAGFGSSPRISLRADDLSEPAAEAAFALPLHIQICCILPGRLLVVGGILPRPFDDVRALSLTLGTHEIDLLEGLIRVDAPGAQRPVDRSSTSLVYVPSSFLFVTRLSTDAALLAQEARVRFSCAHGNAVSRPRVRSDASEAQTQFTAHVASVDPNARLDLFERMATLLDQPPAAGASLPREAPSVGMSGLFTQAMAVAVKELPAHVDYRESQRAVQIYLDRAIRIVDEGLFLIGWFHADPKSQAQVIYQADGREFDLCATWVRWPRTDVDAHLTALGLAPTEDPGFFCYVPRKTGAHPDYLTIRIRGGRVWRIRLPEPAAESKPQAIRAVLATVDPNRHDLRRLLDRHVGPAVGALWAAHVPARHRGFVNFFGPPCDKPDVSVVVPLYGRHDFADYQLALFADDPDFQRVDLIYVVDDPAILQEFRRQCPDLYGMHRVPFTMAFPGDNLGFAGATNYGAAIARAPYLLLLNSDVMPQQAGWLGRLLAIHAARPDTGVLGAKLLYEDGTVQHAGMTSRRSPQLQDLWINHHPHKGLSPVGLSGVMDVESVTAACALVETGLYRSLGGLSEQYIVGDFEDSDLCHRMRGQGRVNRVALDVSLYHLERQSQALAGDAAWRQALTIYNCWLHNRRWASSMQGPPA